MWRWGFCVILRGGRNNRRGLVVMNRGDGRCSWRPRQLGAICMFGAIVLFRGIVQVCLSVLCLQR